MAEYIERRIATNAVGSIDTTKPSDDKDDIVEKAIGVIDHIPAADVAPVVHGEVDMLCAPERVEVDCMCKACGTRMRTDDNYCPNCGAKMKKEQISQDLNT